MINLQQDWQRKKERRHKLSISGIHWEDHDTHKFNNLEERDQFIKKHKLPQLTQYEIDHLNSPITTKEIEFVAEKLPLKKSPDPDVHWRILTNVQEELIPILYNLFQNIKEEGALPNLFYETLIPTSDKDSTKPENYRPIST